MRAWTYTPEPPAEHPLRDMLMGFGAVVLAVGVAVYFIAGGTL